MQHIIEFCEKVNNINVNPYMNKLKENISVNIFITSQEGFVSAVDNWSKILALLVAKVPSYKERSIIIENLFDEHGKGDINDSHVNTFNLFLKSLGHNESLKPYLTYKSSRPVNTFNKKLEDMIRTKDWKFCASALGMIEFTYITVSNNIHNYAKNYLEPDKIFHYNLHEILDVKHATDLFSIVEKYYDDDKENIQSGIIYGYNLMDSLYNELAKFYQ